MLTLGAMFDGAKYYDNIMKLYIDELPDGYYEKDGDIYLSSSNTKTESIILLK